MNPLNATVLLITHNKHLKEWIRKHITQVAYLDLRYYSKTCLKRPLKKKTKIGF